MKKKAILILLIILLSVFGLYKIYIKKIQYDDITTNVPGLTLWEINYVKNVKGKPVWSLRVESAVKDERTGVLTGKGIKLTVFKKGKAAVFLTAGKGRADVKKGIFQVWGNVCIRMQDDNCSLITEKIQYDEKKKRLFSNSDAVFRCHGLQLKGRGLLVDLESRSIQINGSIRALLD